MQALEAASPDALCAVLSSEHPGIVYRASQLLFAQGAPALHDLVLALSDRRPSGGGCGSSARESSFTIRREMPVAREYVASTSVGDRSLYLIEAIARGDFGFQRHCYRGIPGDLLAVIQGRLLALGPQGTIDASSLPDILRILDEYNDQLVEATFRFASEVEE